MKTHVEMAFYHETLSIQSKRIYEVKEWQKQNGLMGRYFPYKLIKK